MSADIQITDASATSSTKNVDMKLEEVVAAADRGREFYRRRTCRVDVRPPAVAHPSHAAPGVTAGPWSTSRIGMGWMSGWTASRTPCRPT
jgi:sucrose-6-phosphate hydrolase SacC (GH32 family)